MEYTVYNNYNNTIEEFEKKADLENYVVQTLDNLVDFNFEKFSINIQNQVFENVVNDIIEKYNLPEYFPINIKWLILEGGEDCFNSSCEKFFKNAAKNIYSEFLNDLFKDNFTNNHLTFDKLTIEKETSLKDKLRHEINKIVITNPGLFLIKPETNAINLIIKYLTNKGFNNFNLTIKNDTIFVAFMENGAIDTFSIALK